jgi:hypothetical protein
LANAFYSAGIDTAVQKQVETAVFIGALLSKFMRVHTQQAIAGWPGNPLFSQVITAADAYIVSDDGNA